MYDYNISNASNTNNTSNTMSIDYIWQSIVNYFIDNTITINDTDNRTLKFKKFLLKYKRIIGLILLIILLLIGYYCEPYSNNSNSNDNSLKSLKKQKGGAAAIASAAAKINTSAVANAAGAAKNATAAATNAAGAATNAAGEDGEAGDDNKPESQYPKMSRMYEYGSRAGNSAKEWSGWLYSIIYSVAISLLLCIIVVPSIAFFIIGIICYFLLKNNMKMIKGF